MAKDEVSRHRHKPSKNDASTFKRRSLRAIERRKKMQKMTFAFLVIMAILMATAVIFAYTIG